MILNIVNLNPINMGSNNSKLIVLENLLQAHRERNHIVLSDRKILKNLLELDCISRAGKTTLSEIILLTRELNSLISEFEVICEVDFDSTDIVNNIDLESKKKKIVISFDHFQTSDKLQPSVLISENDTDFELYEYIANHFIKSNSNFNIELKLQKICGYGSHCFRVYSDHQNNKKFALCIVDCDKKHPNAPNGSTAKQFKSAPNNINGTVEVSILEVREAESLLPNNIIHSTIVEGDYEDNMLDIYDKFSKLSSLENTEFRSFFDHKEGISLKAALKADQKYFWRDFFKDDSRILIKDCYKNSICTECGSCIKIDGFGDKILEKSLKKLKTQNSIRVFNDLPEDLTSYWTLIGKKITAWGCVPNGRKARFN